MTLARSIRGITLVALLASAGFYLSCGGSGTAALPSASTQEAQAHPNTPSESAETMPDGFLFEVEHRNFAWVPTLHGFYVDSTGSVCAYNVGEDYTRWELDRRYSGGDLWSKLKKGSDCQVTVPAETLSEKQQLVERAAAGDLTPQERTRCKDFGTTTFYAFQYRAEDESYRPVLLYAAGDNHRENESKEAALLTEWLKELVPRFGNPECPSYNPKE